MVLLAFSHIDSMSSNGIEAMPKGAWSYLAKGTNQKAKRERLCAVTLLCRLLEAAGYGVDDIEVQCDEHGRPYLVNSPFLDFNLSHSGGMCTCALGNVRVGVDIQEMTDVDISKLSTRFYSERERWCRLKECDDPHSLFFSFWTKKEALGKYLGTGVATLLKEDIDKLYAEHDITPWQMLLTYGDKRYSLTLCSRELPEVLDCSKNE